MPNVQPSQVQTSEQPQNQKKTAKKKTYGYCILCRAGYLKDKAQAHVHSMLHHNELEAVLGKNASHDCEACQVKSLCLKDYAQHIATAKHKSKFKLLVKKHPKPFALERTLGDKIIKSILEKNKILKKQRQKEKKQWQKQNAKSFVKRAENKTAMPSNEETQEKSRGAPATKINTAQAERNNFVSQNKENNASNPHKLPFTREFNPLHQTDREVFLSGEPMCISQSQDIQNKFLNLAYQHGFEDKNSSVNRQIKVKVFQTEKQPERSSKDQHNVVDLTTRDSTNEPDSNIRQAANREVTAQNEGAAEKTSRPGSSDAPRAESVSKPSRTIPTGEVDVGSMLKQIRRALGVREPCRADREARKQSQARTAGTDQPADVSLHSSITSALFAPTPGLSRASQEDSSSRGEKSFAPGVRSACSVNVGASQRSFSNTGKFQSSHKPQTVRMINGPLNKPTWDKGSASAKSKLGWKDTHVGMTNKNEQGGSRFGHQYVNWQSESADPALDIPLSEEFHWESMADSSSGTEFVLPHPVKEKQPKQNARRAPKEPDFAQAGCSKQKPAEISVKVEPTAVDEMPDLTSHNFTRKRKSTVEGGDGCSEISNGKKKKAKSNQIPMDQLLAVSLREDELSRTLQELDKSLVQARHVLQTAYAECQKLVLLRQQVTAEVDSLRTKRIEILQGMQEGYSGSSGVPEKAVRSPGPQTPPSTSLSPFASFSALQTSSPLTSLTPPAVSLKQEIFHPVGLFPIDAPQVPLHHPVPSFPSKVLPSLLLGQSNVAELKPAASPKSSQSAKALTPESFGRELEDYVETDVCVKKETPAIFQQAPASESAKETNRIESKAEEAEPAAPTAQDDGSESDGSVQEVETLTKVIHIDESECEESAPAQPQARPKSESIKPAVSPKLPKSEPERNHQTPPILPKEENPPPEVVEEKEPSVGAFSNHTGPVHSLQIYDGMLYTCSGDNTARAYCLVTKKCKAVFEGHTNKVNFLMVSSLPNMLPRLYTGSSDQTVRCYSTKTYKCLEQISLSDRVLCLHINWNILYIGLANGSVVSYDLRTMKELDVFECHGPRGISCLGTTQEGARRLLLVGSYDSTISVRDAKSGLLLRSLEGHTKTVLCMKVVNDLVFSGSSDTSVHAHNIHTGELIRIYKGHGHAVTSIVILGKVMVTACLDKLVRVYELQSHDRLQVYGGHSDMVMCMAVHKSIIYTGCYDGSIQAVRLNLIKNHRCWWHGCSLIFGMQEHLIQHLTGDHSNPNLQTVKCRWRNCNTIFSSQNSIRGELPEHMQRHIEDENNLQP